MSVSYHAGKARVPPPPPPPPSPAPAAPPATSHLNQLHPSRIYSRIAIVNYYDFYPPNKLLERLPASRASEITPRLRDQTITSPIYVRGARQQS